MAVFPRFEARGWHQLSDGTVMLEERFYDTAPELIAIATGAGLAVEQVWGGLDGSELEMDSRRVVMLARKS